LELSWACGPIGRNLLRISSAAILVAGAAACAPEPPPAEHTVARHAILIVIDTLRADEGGSSRVHGGGPGDLASCGSTCP